MVNLLALFSTSILMWVALALINAKFKLFNKLGLGSIPSTMQFWGLIVSGLLITGAGAGIVGNLGMSATAVNDNIVTADSLIGEVEIQLAGMTSNATDVTTEYYNTNADIMTYYTTDALNAEGEDQNFTLTISRSAVSEDAVLRLSCNMPDLELTGETDKTLAQKTSGKVDLWLDSNQKFSDDNTVYKDVVFSEGTSSVTVNVEYDHDESYHDAMTDYEDVYTIFCEAGGVPAEVRVISSG